MKKTLVCIAAALLLCGCTTSAIKLSPPLPDQKSSAGHPVAANVQGVINGAYLFYFIPLWSGFPWAPNERDYETFKNFVTPQYMIRMMEYYRDRHKYKKVEDLEIKESSSGAWGLWIVWRRSVSGRAVMVGEK
ncbi:MAG: hypothetical protein MJ016_03060 [Victivallaceae bacterium]|nr:hypothetical protein [Victivallaceae bacterium]